MDDPNYNDHYILRKNVMSVTKTIFNRLEELAAHLTATEQRIARIIANDPELIAFGTAASVAQAAETSAPSIVRFAAKLGFAGFSELQASMRRDISTQISSAYKRAQDPAARHDIAAWIEIETLNVTETLSAIDEQDLKRAVGLLTDTSRRIFILSSEQWVGTAITLHDFLRIIRPRVYHLQGSPFRVASELGRAESDDVLLTMDAQRNESWVVETHNMACGMGLRTIAITDGPFNVIATRSETNFRVSQATCGLFDSKTGLTALLSYLLDAVSKQMDESVVTRLAHMETIWSKGGLLKPT
jgi:DNA-binding MurR/RpiR family transcriptional regulator